MIDKTPYKILVVEDNDGDFLLVNEYIHDKILEPEVVRSYSFKDVELEIQKGNEFDIIFLDLSLPDKTGETLITDIIKLSNSVPVVILTGYTDQNFAVQCLTIGASDYLLKDEMNSVNLHKSILYNIERAKNLKHIKDSEHRYSELFQKSPLPLWVYDYETLKFLDVNQAAIKHYGYSLDEFLAMTIVDIRPKEDIDKLFETMNKLVRNNQVNDVGVFNHKKKNGEIIQVHIQSNVIEFNGRTAVIILANDITQQIKQMTAITEQNAKLSEIAWLQSHIVRAPVARIMALVDHILQNMNDEAELNKHLGYIKNSADELDAMIANIVEKTELVEINQNIDSK